MRKNKKKMLGIVGVVIGIVVIFLELVHPTFISAEGIECAVSDNFALMIETTGNPYLDNFGGKLPSEDGFAYRRVNLCMYLTYTSLIPMESMQIYVKDIDCENAKYVVMENDGRFTEGNNGETRLCKKRIGSLFMLVYIGDLDTEEEIKERVVDIMEHTSYEMIYNMQWLGNRTYTWRPRKKIDKYTIWDNINGREIKMDE